MPDFDDLEDKFKTKKFVKKQATPEELEAAAKAAAKVKTELLDDHRAQSLAVFLGSKEKMFMFWVNAIQEVDLDILKPDKAIQLRDALPHIRQKVP